MSICACKSHVNEIKKELRFNVTPCLLSDRDRITHSARDPDLSGKGIRVNSSVLCMISRRNLLSGLGNQFTHSHSYVKIY